MKIAGHDLDRLECWVNLQWIKCKQDKLGINSLRPSAACKCASVNQIIFSLNNYTKPMFTNCYISMKCPSKCIFRELKLMHLKMSPAKWWPFCFNLNHVQVLTGHVGPAKINHVKNTGLSNFCSMFFIFIDFQTILYAAVLRSVAHTWR